MSWSIGRFRNNYTLATRPGVHSGLRFSASPTDARWLTGRYGVAAHATAASIRRVGVEGAVYSVVCCGRLLALRGLPGETGPAAWCPADDMIAVVAALGTERAHRAGPHDTPYAARVGRRLYELCLLAAQLPGALTALARRTAGTPGAAGPGDHWRTASTRCSGGAPGSFGRARSSGSSGHRERSAARTGYQAGSTSGTGG